MSVDLAQPWEGALNMKVSSTQRKSLKDAGVVTLADLCTLRYVSDLPGWKRPASRGQLEVRLKELDLKLGIPNDPRIIAVREPERLEEVLRKKKFADDFSKAKRYKAPGAHAMMNIVRLDQLVRKSADPFHLPPYQRAPVWSPERQRAYLQTLIEGDPSMPWLVWERCDPETGKRVRWLLDGQQRAMAIGARVLRHDGTANPDSSVMIDPMTGTFCLAEDAPPYAFALRELIGLRARLDAYWQWETEHPDWGEALGNATRLADHLADAPIFILELGGWRGCTAEQAARAFRSINRPGEPISPEEVDRLMKSCEGWTP